MLTLNRFFPRRSICRLVVFSVRIATGSLHLVAAPADYIALNSAEDLYAAENLLKVELFLEPAAWDKVRFAKHGERNSEWAAQPGVEILEYVSQRGDIVINGKRLTNVSIRKKGLVGSVSAQRPSLKIKLDGQSKGQDGLAIQELRLNNNVQDPAQMRQYLAY